MLFNSLQFMAFFPAVTLLYFVLPGRVRWGWLLVASYVFYMGWNPGYALLMALSTVLTYLCGRVVGGASGQNAHRVQKWAMVLCIGINLAILFFFKYYGFFRENVVALGAVLGVAVRVPAIDVLLPVGISFYTFQAIGYTVDVYRGDIKPEKNLGRYALFVSFFPQLVAGPIERSENILPQLYLPHRFEYERVKNGLAQMLWGYFQKMVVADRVALLVNGAWAEYESLGGGVLLVAAVFFAVEIYCDFAGYSNIALGAAQVLGVRLMDNFRQPYLAVSLQDFWHRWHISLSSWFRDYVYIPLGGNRKGRVRKYLNNILTFLASGLWHGANWTYVVWGLWHGVGQVVGDLTRPARARLRRGVHLREGGALHRGLARLFIFAFVVFGYVFFRAGSLAEAAGYLGQMLTAPFGQGDIFSLGLNEANFIVALCCIGVCLVVDVLAYRSGPVPLRARVAALPALARGALYLAGLLAIVIFGMYGEGYAEKPFLYFQF